MKKVENLYIFFFNDKFLEKYVKIFFIDNLIIYSKDYVQIYAKLKIR